VNSGYFADWLCAASLVYFDTSALAGRTIDSATLEMTVYSAPVGFDIRNWVIRGIATPWSTNSITWNSLGTMSFYTSGVLTLNYPLYSSQDYAIDATNIVGNWDSGYWSNNGLLLESESYLNLPGYNSFDAYEFVSEEYGGSYDGPRLTVTYH
jgi:hypothetical protein